MKKMILMLFLTGSLISCNDQDEAKKVNNPKTISNPEATILGLWQHGPHDLEQVVPNPIDFVRAENEIDLPSVEECDVSELLNNFSTDEMQKTLFFHFKSEELLDISLVILVPSIDYMCQTEARHDAPYKIDSEGNLTIESSGSYNYVGSIDLIDYGQMRLFTGPI